MLQRPALRGGPKCSLIVERWSWLMETRAPPELPAFVTSGIQCDRRRIFFIWIRRNPLESPDSTKEIQGNPSFFPWIYLDFLGFPCTNLAGVRALSLRR